MERITDTNFLVLTDAHKKPLRVRAAKCVVQDGLFNLMDNQQRIIAGFPIHSTKYVVQEAAYDK